MIWHGQKGTIGTAVVRSALRNGSTASEIEALAGAVGAAMAIEAKPTTIPSATRARRTILRMVSPPARSSATEHWVVVMVNPLGAAPRRRAPSAQVQEPVASQKHFAAAGST